MATFWAHSVLILLFSLHIKLFKHEPIFNENLYPKNEKNIEILKKQD